jgi:hypothetical protein
MHNLAVTYLLCMAAVYSFLAIKLHDSERTWITGFVVWINIIMILAIAVLT